MKHFLSLDNYTTEQIKEILMLSLSLKKDHADGVDGLHLKNRSFALIFEKPSTRTFVSFQVGIHQLGGNSVVINQSSLGGRETLADVARTLSRYTDGLIVRTFSQSKVEELSKHATVPVINALTDLYHPCQALADYQTIIEHLGDKKIKITYLGDGFNVAHSLMLLSGHVGYELIVCTPKGFEPDEKILNKSKKLAKSSGGSITLSNDPQKAVELADVLYTDTWTSMGQEEEEKKRIKIFSDFQINKTLLSKAAKDCLVMHCLPAHRGQEITNDIIDGPQSVVFDQAENRLHIQKAILAYLVK